MGWGMDDAQDVGVELEITGLAGGGRGVAREGGRAWLLAGGLPGQRVRARARRVHSRWVDGVVLEVLRRSPEERPAPCPFFAVCGGCAWMELAEDVQRRFKRQVVVDALTRLSGMADPPVTDTVPSPSALAYRNKVELTFGRGPDGSLLLGFHPPHEARTVVDVATCLLADAGMNRVVEVARAFFLSGPGRGDQALPRAGDRRDPLRLVVRRSRAEGTLLVALRGEPGPFPTAPAFARRLTDEVPEVVGVVRLLSRRGRRGGSRVDPLVGVAALRESLGGLSFEVPAGSFFQVNPEAAEQLLLEVLEAAGPVAGREILELYGGMGVFGLALARGGGRVTVCEADPDAVDAGRRAASRAGLDVAFYTGDVLPCLVEAGRRPPNLILADPPRSGFAPGVAEAIAALRAPAILVVSCDPGTLARDLRALRGAGYAVERVVPVDLFPQTPHVETVTRLRRVEPPA